MGGCSGREDLTLGGSGVEGTRRVSFLQILLAGDKQGPFLKKFIHTAARKKGLLNGEERVVGNGMEWNGGWKERVEESCQV